MDPKLLATTALTVFLAEMGDKTQLATFSLASSGGSKWSVFLGSALGLVAAAGVAVLAGELVGRYVPAVWIRRAAGALFIALGAVYLFSKAEA